MKKKEKKRKKVKMETGISDGGRKWPRDEEISKMGKKKRAKTFQKYEKK